MPSGPRYERVPLEEENLPTSTTANNYFTGLPNTAPPSFRTIPLDQQSFSPSLPHRHDESAATVMPASERPERTSTSSPADDPAISLWGATESVITMRENSSREDILVRLLDAVERLEGRLDAKAEEVQNKEEIDLEASREEKRAQRTKEILGALGGIFVTIVVLVWLGAIIIIPAVAKYKYAGAIAAAAAASIPTSSQG
ncbi:uncharacterized protein LY89DRAFT_720574 [Mollisia scopiformis]|uniref:Uncharacterized protein n=1 Tax=Mollisia scopiformis TaxID=149040 RepID=A0A194X2H7_MOLSC|nr:uncharacterized protein LY89DRAFT_720574 [Mollisia scopiformis]KUJ14214.1 hypothetical protein LY89DRAFT_720574 [Mollisia scopiformis]